jgi:hypothetical protein
MSALHWLTAFVLALIIIVVVLCVMHLAIRLLGAVFDAINGKPLAADAESPHDNAHYLIRQAAMMAAAHELKQPQWPPCPNPHPPGSLESAIWQSTYARYRVLYADV